MSGAWIMDVLRRFPELTSERRDELAGDVLAEVPGRQLAEIIAQSAATVLRQRGIPDTDDLSRELGRNAAATVVIMLQASVAFDDAFDTSDVTPTSPHVATVASEP